jgi:hypothetical protein
VGVVQTELLQLGQERGDARILVLAHVLGPLALALKLLAGGVGVQLHFPQFVGAQIEFELQCCHFVAQLGQLDFGMVGYFEVGPL